MALAYNSFSSYNDKRFLRNHGFCGSQLSVLGYH